MRYNSWFISSRKENSRAKSDLHDEKVSSDVSDDQNILHQSLQSQ